MNSQFTEQRSTIQIEAPNFPGMQNQFFLLMTYLKNSQYSSFPFSVLSLFVNLFFNVLFAIYPVFPYIANTNNMDYFNQIFTSTEFWLLLSFFIIAFTICIFVICFIFPPLTIRFNWILNSQLHLMILPFISLFFGFCPFGFLNYVDFNIFFDIIMFLILILFPIYLIIVSTIFCFDTNSIFRPNLLFAEWFYGSSLFFPILSSIETIFNSIIPHISSVLMYVLSSISIAFHLIYLIHILYKMPFIATFVNQFAAVNSLFLICMNIIILVLYSIAPNFQNFNLNLSVVTVIPIAYTLIFFFVYFICERRRRTMHTFIQQFDANVGEFSVDAIRMTLISYHSEHSIQWIIRDCFISGNKNILSPSFLQYCLELYPKSQWLLSVVSFLHIILWSDNPNLYPILLHLLSVNDRVSILPSYLIYQCVYCLMQSSKDGMSPIIQRDIEHFRSMMALYCHHHEKFWSSAANYDYDTFKSTISEVVVCNKAMKDEMHELITKYPFCPSVHIEASLFYSDVLHDYKNSAKSFSRYSELVNDNRSIAKQLFRDFFNIFPISKPFSDSLSTEDTKKENKDIVFISFDDTKEDAQRCILPSFKDPFYSLSQGFSFPKYKKQFEIDFNRIRLVPYKVVYSLSIIFYVVSLVIYFLCLRKIDDKIGIYKRRVNFLEESVAFMQTVISCYIDSLVLYDYQQKTYNQPENETFINYLIMHLQNTYNSLFDFKNLLNSEQMIDSTLPNCRSINCTFSFIFGYMHNIVTYYSRNNNSIYSVPEYQPETLASSVDLMLDLVNNLYSRKAKEHCNCISDLLDYIGTDIIVLLILEFFSLIVFVVLLQVIEKKLHISLFAVINTVPNAILKHVAHIFQKVFNMIEYVEKTNLKFLSSILMPVFYAFSIFLIMIYPLLVGIASFFNMNREYEFHKIPDINISSVSHSITFSMTYRQYFFLSLFENTDGDYTGHNIKEWQSEIIKIPFDLPNIGPFTFISSPVLMTIRYVLVIVSILFILIYIINGIDVLRLYKTMHHLLRYIPERAWNANPFLSIITTDYFIPIQKVEQFRKDIIQSDLSRDFGFCTIKVQSPNNDLVEINGNISDYFDFYPNNLNDILQCLINQMPEAENQIMEFFTDRSNQTRSVTFNGRTEASISFSKSDKSLMFISDNSSHIKVNSLIRKMQSFYTQAPLKSELIQHPFISVIEGISFNILIKDINDHQKEVHFEFDVVDKRNRIIIIDKKNNIEHQKHFISVLQSLPSRSQWKCCISNEGNLYILGSKVSFPSLKNRAFGSLRDLSTDVVGNLNQGEMNVLCEFDIGTSSNLPVSYS